MRCVTGSVICFVRFGTMQNCGRGVVGWNLGFATPKSLSCEVHSDMIKRFWYRVVNFVSWYMVPLNNSAAWKDFWARWFVVSTLRSSKEVQEAEAVRFTGEKNETEQFQRVE